MSSVAPLDNDNYQTTISTMSSVAPTHSTSTGCPGIIGLIFTIKVSH